MARLKERCCLTGPGSTKRTYHVSLDTSFAPFPFSPGDSIGVLPSHDPQVVDAVLERLGATGEEEVFDKRAKERVPFRLFLEKRANLSKLTSAFLPLVEAYDPQAPKPELQGLALIDLLADYPALTPTPQEIADRLLPLMPRFYSIASSDKLFREEIHLLVSAQSYQVRDEVRYGVGSHFLCELADHQTPIPIYLQPSNGFGLPEDPATPLLMIGPGTGVAPFRAFLQERLAVGASGEHWLFFGERSRNSDFYYADYFLELEKQRRLRLSLAFSRDGAEKYYVQHRMREEAKEVWRYIEGGAITYICGDASRMAKEVELTLVEIAAEQGKMGMESALQFWKGQRRAGKLLLDVY